MDGKPQWDTSIDEMEEYGSFCDTCQYRNNIEEQMCNKQIF